MSELQARLYENNTDKYLKLYVQDATQNVIGYEKGDDWDEKEKMDDWWDTDTVGRGKALERNEENYNGK